LRHPDLLVIAATSPALRGSRGQHIIDGEQAADTLERTPDWFDCNGAFDLHHAGRVVGRTVLTA
jgi:hypothetical protein